MSSDPVLEVAGYPARVYDFDLIVPGLTWPVRLAGPSEPDRLLDLPSTQQRHRREEYMPYWPELWPAAVVLAEWLLKRDDLAGKRVLELGCGLGLAGVAAARQGASVLCTDHDPDALSFAEYNAQVNRCFVQTQLYDFVTMQMPSARWPLIIASDLMYESRLAEPLVRAVAALLEPGGEFLSTTPRRPHVPAALQHFAAAGFAVQVTADATFLPSGTNTIVDVVQCSLT